MPVQPIIEGASPEQRQLLVEILLGIGSTAVVGITLQHWLPDAATSRAVYRSA